MFIILSGHCIRGIYNNEVLIRSRRSVSLVRQTWRREIVNVRGNLNNDTEILRRGVSSRFLRFIPKLYD